MEGIYDWQASLDQQSASRLITSTVSIPRTFKTNIPFFKGRSKVFQGVLGRSLSLYLKEHYLEASLIKFETIRTRIGFVRGFDHEMGLPRPLWHS